MLKKSLFVLFAWQRYLKRNECLADWGVTEDHDRQALHLSCFTLMVNREGTERRLSTSHLKHLPDAENEPLSHSPFPSIFFPSLYGCQTMLSSEGWIWTAAVALRLMTLSRPPTCWVADRGGRSQTVLESPTCLKCTQMQFDPSSGLWEACLVTAALLFILFTICFLKEKKKDIYLVMFLYGFVQLWFQIVVWFVALIFLILPAALSQSPSVVWKPMMCCWRTERGGLLFVEQTNSAVYRDVVRLEGYS